MSPKVPCAERVRCTLSAVSGRPSTARSIFRSTTWFAEHPVRRCPAPVGIWEGFGPSTHMWQAEMAVANIRRCRSASHVQRMYRVAGGHIAAQRAVQLPQQAAPHQLLWDNAKAFQTHQ